MSRVQLGRATVTRIVEFQFQLSTRSFANTPPSGWQAHADLLVPDLALHRDAPLVGVGVEDG